MPERSEKKPQRYLTLDAFRGFVMLMLVSHGFGFGELESGSAFGFLARQFEHVEWEGGVFWDMVQPSFLFIAGAAMPFAFAIRAQQGAAFPEQAKHVAMRSLKLVLLSQILMSVERGEPHFQLINVLSQIAFTYFLTFWILQLKWKLQAVTGLGLLVVHTALFLIFPGPGGPFSREGNIGQVIDQAVLGYTYPGFYVTINFLSSTVTTLIGAWTGRLLLESTSMTKTMMRLVEGAVVSFLMVFAFWALIPGVKRIWTATFTFYSAGWVLLILLTFYYVIEGLGFRKWTFPLVVIGANSIFIYSVSILLHDWLSESLAVFTGGFTFVGELAPVFQSCAVLLVLWLLNYFLYKRRVFIKV